MTRLDKILECIKEDKVYIQMHNFPDPDAVASAYGLQKLLEKKGVSSVICYKGRINGSVTDKLVNRLGVKIVELSELEGVNEESQIILVDAQKGNANIIDMEGYESICIDHHPIYEDAAYDWQDIRTDVGACASIIASYFYENDIPIERDVATMLMYGIKVDTADMTRGVSDLDLEMFYRMFNLVDKELIDEMNNSTLKYDDLERYGQAISTIKRYDDICFADTGYNCPDFMIATISDFLMRLEEVDFTVIYSIKQDGIKLSVRSNGKYDAGHLTNCALDGIGNGGGHENMAGGFVPLDKNIDEDGILDMQNEIRRRFVVRIREL